MRTMIPDKIERYRDGQVFALPDICTNGPEPLIQNETAREGGE